VVLRDGHSAHAHRAPPAVVVVFAELLRAPAPCVLARSRLISSGVRTRQLRGKWSWSYLASAGGDAGAGGGQGAASSR
jgi:hypothetical protein